MMEGKKTYTGIVLVLIGFAMVIAATKFGIDGNIIDYGLTLIGAGAGLATYGRYKANT